MLRGSNTTTDDIWRVYAMSSPPNKKNGSPSVRQPEFRFNDSVLRDKLYSDRNARRRKKSSESSDLIADSIYKSPARDETKPSPSEVGIHQEKERTDEPIHHCISDATCSSASFDSCSTAHDQHAAPIEEEILMLREELASIKFAFGLRIRLNIEREHNANVALSVSNRALEEAVHIEAETRSRMRSLQEAMATVESEYKKQTGELELITARLNEVDAQFQKMTRERKSMLRAPMSSNESVPVEPNSRIIAGNDRLLPTRHAQLVHGTVGLGLVPRLQYESLLAELKNERAKNLQLESELRTERAKILHAVAGIMPNR